ncbi:MAG: Npt1/Npt2 family nucleotide transporter, partial [Parachlamydiaceae bacterium]
MIRPLTCRFKFTFLLLIFTCLSLNNKLLKLIKEACVLTIPEGGITLVPFLKMWLIIPF